RDGRRVEADYYIVAVPLEVMQGLVNVEMAHASEQLDRLRWIDLGRTLGWMVGAQFYLREDVPVTDGHVGYADAPWALTSISQAQFWNPADFKRAYGHGVVGGILSVDMCDWSNPGERTHKIAKACTKDELFAELVHEIGAVRTSDGQPILTRMNVVDW